jgi:xylose isomerase
VAERMLEDGELQRRLDARYAGWNTPQGEAILEGRRSLADLAHDIEQGEIEPRPVSGRQERLEHLVNGYL